MSDLLNYIKMQRNKGLDDYTVLQSTKNFYTNYGKNNMIGGEYYLTSLEKQEVLQSLASIDKNLPGYVSLNIAAESDTGLIQYYDSFDEIKTYLAEMKRRTTEEKINKTAATEIHAELSALDRPEFQPDIQPEFQQGSQPGIEANSRPTAEKTTVIVDTYATLNPGDYLYYPTQNIKQFDDTMIFVDIPKVLNQTKQRSFTMFFTTNEEYARRYSGIWSLNKRPVYVHKLVVKKGMPITHIKVINSKKISDNIGNDELAHGMCGDSIDGYINGIKVENTLGENASVEEYYICNPSLFLDHVETWMQFSATEWIKISKENIKTIQVPPNSIDKPNIPPTQQDVELSEV